MNRMIASILFFICQLSAQEHKFPAWRSSTKSLYDLWQNSPVIAIGNVENVSEIGVETVASLPVRQDLHQLYWCQGDFHVVEVIRGGSAATLPAKFLWGSVNPGCRLFYGSATSYLKFPTRVWFLRVDGPVLRPESDGSAFSYGLLTKWKVEYGKPATVKLGTLLLTPEANVEELSDYADLLWDVADFACTLLTKQICVDRINELAQLGDPKLREYACQYLKIEQKEICKLPR